jgi:nucleoside-diphosphate-sugar epimerase
VGGRTALTKGYSLIHVEDLADAIVAACVKPAPPGAAYFVPGPRDATFEGMLEAIEAAVGRRARRIPVPMAAAAVGAAAAQAVGAILRRASIVNLDKLREASAPGWRCSGAAAARDLGHRPAVDYPDGFARQARFARDAGLL